MTDNIIEFKKKDEEQPSGEGQLLVSMTIKDDGTINVWVSRAIQEPDEIDWIKEMAFNAVFTLGQALEEIDDRYVETTTTEKDIDELNDN